MEKKFKIVFYFIFSYFLFILHFLVFASISFGIDSSIDSIRMSSNSETTRIVLDTTHHAPFSAFILEKPNRLVVDIEVDKVKNNDYALKGIVKEIRIGQQEPGVQRIVFDLNFPAIIVDKFNLKKTSNRSFRAVVDIKSGIKNTNKELDTLTEKNIRNYVIVIDPGHGGVDPGASKSGIIEKDITLKAARELRDYLKKYGHEVYLTRNKDVFLKLRERVKIAREKNADVFLSLHADSVFNRSIRGMSVYTLSSKASDRIARRLARQADKADKISGIDLTEVDDEVGKILLDMSHRHTKNASAELAESLVQGARKRGIRLLRRPHRQAGFAVLKAPDIPSILVEMGFLSNANDRDLLLKKSYRSEIIISLAEVLNDYISNKLAKAQSN